MSILSTFIILIFLSLNSFLRSDLPILTNQLYLSTHFENSPKLLRSGDIVLLTWEVYDHNYVGANQNKNLLSYSQLEGLY